MKTRSLCLPLILCAPTVYQVSLEGLQGTHKAKTKFAANGALAEVTASGILTAHGPS